MKTIKIFFKLALITCLVLGFFSCGKFASSIMDRALVEMASQMNETLPMMLDSETRLDTTMAHPGNTFAYYLTLVNHSAEDLDAEEFNELMRPNIVNGLKSNPDMAAFKVMKINILYVYRDKENIEFSRIDIPFKDYE
ncbi:MAG: hypothetical protein FWD28_04960 [Treponema sp.]|nr:hypothetical protein [Treponema sp.]